jgi:hypothetical protein
MEGRRRAGGNGQHDRARTRDEQRRREQTVVGPDEPSPIALDRQCRTGRADAGIDDGEVHRTGREAPPVLRQR